MASPVVVDSDVFIDYLNGVGAPLIGELIREERLFVTAITAFEVRVGTPDRAVDALEAELDRRTIPIDLRSALMGGAIGRSLAARGQPIGIGDELIAGTCLVHQLPLATRNRRHFERVPGLELVEV